MANSFLTSELAAALTAARISLSSPRAHSAIAEHQTGMSIADAVDQAVRHETEARNSWIERALDPWCKRHDITRQQGLSIAFDDQAFDPVSRLDSLPTRDALFASSGQQNNFAGFLMRQYKEEAQKPKAPKVVHEQANEVVSQKKQLRGFSFFCIFDDFEIGHHMSQATEAIGRIPKYWGVPENDRIWVKQLFSNPRCTGQIISFKLQSACSDADFARYSQLIEEMAGKCHQKKFLFDDYSQNSDGNQIVAFCSLAKGGSSEDVRKAVEQYMPDGWNDSSKAEPEERDEAPSTPGQSS